MAELVIALMLALFPGGTCPPTYFCAPTTGIYGEITPYYDRTGQTEIGPGIVGLRTEKPWLVGHAYTQFWAIVMLRPGDVVYANGVGYVVRGRHLQQAFTRVEATADLSLQTSLGTGGWVIVIHADRE